MGGALQSKIASDLIFGFNSTVAHKVNGGRFLWGNEFAIQAPVTPIFNDKISAMSEQEISMYPGTFDPTYTGIVKYQNGQLQVNRMIKVYNGVSNTTIYKGLDGELEATSG